MKTPLAKYGLIGYPLGHSFSKSYFSEKFQREGLPAVYENFPIASIEAFPALLQNEPTLRGLNVTIPYKEAVLPYLDELSPEAQAIGAVNVIQILRDGTTLRLIGHNCDYIGFYDSIQPRLARLSGRIEALILGTGGASKAVAYALSQANIPYQFVSRQAKTLLDGRSCLTYESLDKECLQRHRLIVNTTPLGMSPHIDACPPLPYEELGAEHFLYDLIYNPLETLFLAKGKAQGAQTMSGLDMLHRQAEATWKVVGQSLLKDKHYQH